MREERKAMLESKLHRNLLNIIDEFNDDYGTGITEVQYSAKIRKASKDDVSYDDVEYTIETDMK